MTLDEQISQITNPQEFTRLCNTILTEKYGHNFQVIDGTRGDEGNDGYIISEKRIIAIYCPIKPERRTDADYLEKIRGDLKKAQSLRDSGKYEVENWTFLTPRKLSNSLIVEMRNEADSLGLKATHQESTFLANELNRNKHLVGAFPSLNISELDSKLDEILELLKTPDLEKRQVAEEIGKDHIYKSEAKNQEELDQVLKIRNAVKSDNTKSGLKAIYYKTSDPVVKLNALLGLLDFYDPTEDVEGDMVHLCSEGIEVSEKLGSLSVKAFILAYKGYMLSSIYSELDMRTAFQIMADNAIGFPTITEEYRQKVISELESLEKEFERAFSEALSITKENKYFNAMGSVLVFIGNAAGQRALYLQNLNAKNRAASEKAICKRALLVAKDIYTALKDELSVANALFNLANQIRFFGEEVEAKLLAKDAIETAKKYDDQRLLQRAKWLTESLETGKIPDYLSGEKRE